MGDTCSNCNQQLGGDFCSFCGQRNNTKRISTKQIATDIFNNLFNVDSPIWATLRMTIVNPGLLSRNYISGKRKCYFHPVRYFVIAMALYYLFVWLFDYNPVNVSISGVEEGDGFQQNAHELGLRVSNIIRKNINLLMFVWIVMISVLDRLFYRKHDLNIAERSIHYFYTLGTYTILFSPFIAFDSLGFSPDYIRIACLLIYLPYSIMSFHQKRSILHYLKAILLVIISFMLYVVAISALVVAGIFISNGFHF